MKIFKGLVCLGLAASLFAGCSDDEEKNHVNHNLGEKESLISNRPITSDGFVAMVRLEKPALLANPVYGDDGHVVFDPVLAGQILVDQERVIADFKRISAEAKVIYRYRNVLNAIAIYIPPGMAEQFSEVIGVAEIRPVQQFYLPKYKPKNINSGMNLDLLERNSVKFIGAQDAHQYLSAEGEAGTVKLRGQGIRVGIIDSGIDYTHKMFGGPGEPEAFASVNPNGPTTLFPNAKVVGGYDFVGSEFDVGSHMESRRIPQPDNNPIDEMGHGTHVAGTVAGVGDYIKSHDGVAPDALLYSLKVFGRSGSTSDSAIIASFEYSVDPDGDLDTSDRLDVVNLSLGGNFGKPYEFYKTAVGNAVKTGLVVVAAAGNSGATDFIVGSPSTADDAISVAASIDNAYHNWQFNSVKVEGVNREPMFVKSIEGDAAIPISDVSELSGELYHIGLANTDLTEEQQAQLKGKIALIDRGEVTFVEKLTRAKAGGAIGAIVVNNVTGEPFQMGSGGQTPVEIPAIMVSLDKGNLIKEMMGQGTVRADFKTNHLIEEPQLIDTITGFSSKGPRAEDYLIKPEISAPGNQIVSAAIGGGDVAVMLDGTSMATPHIAGVMALLKQLHPDLTPAQLKSLLLTGAKTVNDADGKQYPVSMQGAGRVQVLKSAMLPIVVDTPAISLGQIQVSEAKNISGAISVTNITSSPVRIRMAGQFNGMMMKAQDKMVELGAGETRQLSVELAVSDLGADKVNAEVDGFVQIHYTVGANSGRIQIPVLAYVTKMSKVDLLVTSFEPEKDQLILTYKNTSAHSGDVLAFNYIGHDDRKVTEGEHNSHRSRSCDLQSAGYRIVNKPNPETGEPQDYLQVAVKLHSPVSSWQACEVSVQIDKEGDGIIEQELAGIEVSDLIQGASGGYVSVLLDAPKVKEIRQAYEDQVREGGFEAPQQDYIPALLSASGMISYDYSTLAIVEAPLSLIAQKDGSTFVKVASLHDNPYSVEADDFMGNQLNESKKLDLTTGFVSMPEVATIDGGQTQSFTLNRRGAQPASLVIYTPHNQLPSFDPAGHQVKILKFKD